MSELNEDQIRQQKLQKIVSMGINPYPARYAKKQSLKSCFNFAEGKKVKTAGRIMMYRDMGKLTFAHLQDITGRMQIAFRLDDLGEKNYKDLQKIIDLGDHLGVEGEIFITHKGEKTILVRKWTFLGKALKPMPEKWHGLQDIEVKYRQRYLDLLSKMMQVYF